MLSHFGQQTGSKTIAKSLIEYFTWLEHNFGAESTRLNHYPSLLDIERFAAELLATEYHQRWEVENTLDELKIHLLGRKTHIRSQIPREVVQEVYGWLLGHWAVRVLMFQAATSAGVSPLRLSNTYTLRIIRRAMPKFQRLNSEELPLFSLG